MTDFDAVSRLVDDLVRELNARAERFERLAIAHPERPEEAAICRSAAAKFREMVETAEDARHDPDLRWFIEAIADSFLWRDSR
jgi:hypothetical protein